MLGEPISRAKFAFPNRIGLLTINENERSFYWRLTGRQNLDFLPPFTETKAERNREELPKFYPRSVSNRNQTSRSASILPE